MRRKTSGVLYLIIFLALALRLAGIQHGFPFIFHPDEPTIVRSALGVRFDPNPKHFDWPHLFIYLNFFVYKIFAWVRDTAVDYNLQNFFLKIFPLMWDDRLVFYYLTRVFAAVLGGLTVIPVYKTGKTLFGEKVGLFSALAFALIPFHVWHSHYSLPDAPMLFFMAWGVYFASRIFVYGYPIDYAVSGFFIGLSASTKYNGGLAGFIVPLVAFLRWAAVKMKLTDFRENFPYFKTVLNILLAGMCAVFSFVLGTPYSVLDYKTFIRTDGPQGAFWQFKNVGSVPFYEHLGKFYTDVSFKISDDLGYTMLVALFLSCGLVFVRFLKKTFSKYDLSLLFMIIPTFAFIYYISGFERSRSQYYFVTYPFMSLIFGYFCVWITHKMRFFKKVFYIPIIVILFAPLLYMSVYNSIRFLRNDTRLDLLKFLQSEVPLNTKIVYTSSEVESVVKYVFNNASKGPENLSRGTKYYLIELDKGVSSGKALFEVSNEGRIGPYITVEERIK